MLKNGTPAPQFTLPSHDGSDFTLADHKGKVTVLIFHRGKFCPTTDRFLASYQDFSGRMKEMNMELVAISTDALENQVALAQNLRVKFPLLTDKDFSVCEQYGVYRSNFSHGAPYAEPALIVIDVDGKVCYSVISSGPKGLPLPGDVAPVLLYMNTHGGRY